MSELEGPGKEFALIAMGWLRGIQRASAEAADGLAAMLEQDVEPEVPALRGPWQRKIARLPGLALEYGLTGGQIASAAGYDEANTYTVLAALEKSGLVEKVEGASPKRWRLAVAHRRDRMLQASRVILGGEWTTYGEIAIAVSGNVRVARAVGRVAAKSPAFANPHRVLKKGGVIPPDWRDDDGRGPDECERLLREEGVEFVDGAASSAAKIGWEEIQSRLVAVESEDSSD